eukprot:779535-Ditylum_brightwellii.AAC.1
MASNTSTVEELERSFPHSLNPKIQGEPTYEKLYKIQKLLMENVASIETLYGGGNHGHLGHVINLMKYLQEAGQNFVIPPRPFTTPNLAQQFMLQAEMDTIYQDHKAAITRYYTAHNVDKTLKKQVVDTILPKRIGALCQPLLGLTKISYFT